MAIIARGQITVNSVADSLSGANLLLDTQAPYLSNTSIWNLCNGASLLSSVGNFSTVKITSNWGRCWQRVALQPNKTYTFSCWLKRDAAVEQNTTLLSWFQGNDGGTALGLTLVSSTFGKSLSGVTAPTEFTRCYWTFKTSSTYSDTSVPRLEPYCTNYSVASPCLVVYGYQLEEGEVMSDWKPNAADYTKNTEFRYAKNTSATTSPAITQSSATPAGWSLTQQTLSAGEYLWESFAIKTNAGALLQNWSNPVRKNGEKGDGGDAGESITGKMLFRDPEFRVGMNSCQVYNNSGGGTVVLSRISKPTDCPTTSPYCLQIAATGAASPRVGGFVQGVSSRADAIFLTRIVAKIPVGYTLAVAHNLYGTGGTTNYLTSMAGTGRYEVYLIKVRCGSIGTFGSINHYYLSTGSFPVTWYVASATCYDMTDSEKYDDAIANAANSLFYRGNFSSTTPYYSDTYRRECVKYNSNYYIYKGSSGASGAWSSSNWELFGSQFESVATGMLLAELAYIENLGVKNLKTGTSGQRVEITQGNNALAFYDGVQAYPVVEIKTTSDSIYMGQGSGILVKHPASNISINNGILQNGTEGSGVEVPILGPAIVAQNSIIQTYSNSYSNKYKTGLHIDIGASQSTASGTDKFTSIFANAGIFLAGSASAFRSNNVLCGVTAAGRVSASGSLLYSWVISYMGGYLTSSRTSEGRYRVSFSNTGYLNGATDYQVFILAEGPHSSNVGAYGCTMARTSSYFDVWISDDASPNDCGFTFIVFLLSKFF